MPFATQMVGGFNTNEFTCLLYIGTIVVNSVCVSLMTLTVKSDPALLREGDKISGRWLFNTLGTTIAVAAAFLLEVIVPSVNYYGLLLLLAPPIVARFVHPEAPKPTQLSE
jgi:uncharacterized membrane protein